MKFRLKETLIALAAAVAATLGSMLIFRMTILQAAPMGISFLVFIVIFGSRKNFEIDAKDERMRKLSLVSMGYSWLLTLFALIGIYWIDYFHLVNLTIGNVVFLLLVVMTFSIWIFRFIFSRKGDIE